MEISAQSIAQLDWPKERVSINLCPKCGDRFQLNLQEFKFDEILHSVRSGCSPDGVESVVYSELLADAQKNLYRCQSELRRMDDLANAFKEQQELLLMYMAGIRSIMSPIRKLPCEILVEVFKYLCCDGASANCILPGDEKQLPTLTLSRVCLQWHNLVTSTPVLWSSFGTQDLTSSHNTSLFKVFLERSYLHPIDFVFDDSRSWLRKFLSISEIPSDSLPGIVANAHRWRRVAIKASESIVRAVLEPLIACEQSLPALVSLDIKSQIPDVIAFPITCPNLQSLTLSEVALEFEGPLLAVTHLDFQGITLSEASEMIAWCPNVQDITLNFLFPETIALPTSLEVPLPAVTHLDLDGLPAEDAFRLIARCPNLHDISFKSLSQGNIVLSTSCIAQRLVVEFGEFPSIVDLLCDMTFPELVHLVLSDSYLSTETRNVKNLCPALERSHRHLTHLSLHRINFSPGQLLPLFLSVPTVTVLDLEESPVNIHAHPINSALRSLIAPSQINQPEDLDEDGDNDEVTLDSKDQLHEDGDELESDDGEEDDENLETDDDEDKETLDMCDKAKNFKVLGLCLLPRLKELNLVIHPRNELLLQLVRSRWRPLLVSIDDNSGSGACVCLQTLRMEFPGPFGTQTLERLKALEKSLYRFKKAGMVVEVLKLENLIATV